jgi:beta-1,4-N-acetylglucosaminyltransferase
VRHRSERPQLLLVCSTGGHLLQLHALREAWEPFSRVWVTFDSGDTRSLLAGEDVIHAYGPTNRNIPNLLRNLVLAARVLVRLRPRAILATGAGVSVPFAWVGRLFGARIVFVESMTRIESPSLSCRLIRPTATRLYVQWPELQERLPSARFHGNVMDTT